MQMKQQKVYMLAGIPGSGKSTWAKQQIAEHGGVWCSRDAVRFSMVAEDEPYFSKEDAVFNSWISQILKAIESGEDVYIDATHINPGSRRKVLRWLRMKKSTLKNATLYGVNFLIPKEVCYMRNSQRTGREKVPNGVVRNFSMSFTPITTDEGFDKIIVVHYEGGE